MKPVLLKITLPLSFAVLMLFSSFFALANEELRFPDDPPPEPSGYRHKEYRAVVPLTLEGAHVVSDKEAMALYQSEKVVFIDVMPFTPRPPNLPMGTIWRDQSRQNIARSIWLANVGYGRLPPEMDLFFRMHLKKLTEGNWDKPLLFYCQRDCWMSWNAAKRALEYGYSTIYWYPDGTDGWVKAGGKIVSALPEPLPDLTREIAP